MRLVYHEGFNIEVGPLARLHPFDGAKFRRIHQQTRGLQGLEALEVPAPVSQAAIDDFAGPLLRRLLKNKRYVLQALELPYVPLLPFSLIENRILMPMRWAVAGTAVAAASAARGASAWNLGGGFHHASAQSAEGFCLYNDIGIALRQLAQQGLLGPEEPLLVIDVDAHHGNGNARVFMDDRRAVLLDVYNADLYPQTQDTRERVDIGVPLASGTGGGEYLSRLEAALARIEPRPYRLAFVVAGTDVLASDPLGGLRLSVEDCVARDQLVLRRLAQLSVPAVVLGGGGYGPESAQAVATSLARCALAQAAPVLAAAS